MPQVLIAEDDGELRGVLAERLTDRGVSVMQAADGMRAAQMLKDDAGILLLVSDVKMPRMGGYALVEEALAHNPELKILMMAAYEERLPPAALKAREIRVLPKPFALDDMCDRVIDMLARP